MSLPAPNSLTLAEQARDFAQSIVATMREPLLVLDETLHVAFANRSFYATFGVVPEDTDGRLLYELGNGQWDIPALRHLLEEIVPRDNEVTDFAVTHTFPQIGTRYMLLNARKIWQPGNLSVLLLLAIEDVTERTMLQESLRSNEEQLRTMIEGVTDYAMFQLDENGIVQSWNIGAERIIGYQESQIVGQPFHVIFTQEDCLSTAPEREMVRAMQTGRADDIRWHLRQDGSRFFADGVLTKITGDDGAARGYVKILRDVTARTLVEENLRETEERSRFAAGAAQIGTWDYQPLTGSLIWDSRCKAFFGLDPEAEVTRDTALARLHPDDVALATEAIVAAFNPDSPDTFDLVFRTVSGLDNAKTRYIHAKGQAMRGSDGTAYRFLGIMQDVSEQKLLAAELLEAGRKNERIAETLQRSLLLAPPPDAFPGITLKTYYESAWDDALIGGDFFDVFAVAENVVGVVVGDVTGKGLEAATYTAEIKFILRGFLRETGDPADAMARLNRFVVDAERLDAADLGSTYIALSLACINTLTGQVECVTAGAEPPLLFRAGATGAEEVPPSGTMLGVAPDAKYVCYRYELAPGDLYIAYTDGVTEARRGKIFWGQEGLVNAVIETTFTRGDSLSTIADEIARRAKEWANGRQQDDVCLLLVRRL